MVIDQEKMKSIIGVLHDHGDESLTKEFRAIVAMARSRQQAKSGIEDQSLPIFLYLIPFAILTNRDILPPVKWKTELKDFFGNIDVRNSGKRRVWFSEEQIRNMLDGLLTLQVKKQILNKLEAFKGKTYYVSLTREIDRFFAENKKLRDLGIELKHLKDEGGLLSLALFVQKTRIF